MEWVRRSFEGYLEFVRLFLTVVDVFYMITYATAWQGPLFDELVRHFESYSTLTLGHIARIYSAPVASPKGVATLWCTKPEHVRQTLLDSIESPWLWDTLEHLIVEHGVPLMLGWLDGHQMREFIEYGIIREHIDELDLDDQYTMPAAMAAVLAPLSTGIRPSLPLILGRLPLEDVHARARRYKLVEGPGVASVLALTEFFSDPSALDQIIGQLPGPEWLGGALIVLELGGVCFWQEVFGSLLTEQDTQPSSEAGNKVVPLMSKADLNQERAIAQTLLDLGLIFKIKEDKQPHLLIAIPEEIWNPLWLIGKMWLVDWASNSLGVLQDNSTRRVGAGAYGGLQPCLKWLGCELEHAGGVAHHPSVPLPEELVQKSSRAHEPSHDHVHMGLEMGVLVLEDDLLTFSSMSGLALDMDRSTFVRRALTAWVNGSMGRRAERSLCPALGVDERWRQLTLELLNENDESHPLWMHFEGVPSEVTGAGYLRPLEQSSEDILRLELSDVTGYIGIAKILWLDALSTLDSPCWISQDLLTELLQLCCACALFEHLPNILQNPGLARYIPVQRASFLTDGFHMAAFNDWVEDILTHFLIPMGIAQRHTQDPTRVSIELELLSVDVPEHFPSSDLEGLRADLLHASAPRRVSSSNDRPRFGVVPNLDGHELSLSSPLDALLHATKHARILSYDGRHIGVERDSGE